MSEAVAVEMMRLGDELEFDGANWIVTDIQWPEKGSIKRVITRIPDGETAIGMGHTWESSTQEKRVVIDAIQLEVS